MRLGIFKCQIESIVEVEQPMLEWLIRYWEKIIKTKLRHNYIYTNFKQ